ncbi:MULTISPECIES: peptidylprolyl isomerase [Shewanella]|uniref:Peptidyl-prolyl cis-trans isomerase n=1 Tax=Shewanella indica TaxID=768528 RepID=A0ABU4QFQ8_9GAMM|nr:MULTISPECIES: peptidylprolyl isomerase [Shewanella]MCL1161800.1 peptidylprolyl isomerase [Shewanella chilikensis]MDX6017095.1 peptidylprolyl isomerase [Shewanella indica]NDO75406.1 peptidylprolyl isomerase [Shewanella sp. SE1]OHY53450.1 peptidylprolyl isomerase [Shewanella algae]OIN10304.1 peptidylprolyl isomerase [Shewanella algae]
MQITQHSAVTIHYRLTDAKGQLIESSFEADPMVYLHGMENLIPGLEKALEGKSKGDTLEVTIDAEEAYGPYHDGLRQEVPLEAFGDIQDIVPGMRFIAETEMGQRPVQVTEVLDNSVIVDGNHPLAGQSLTFNVEVMDVREATAEEIAHGHIHAHGGCGGHGHDHGGCCGGHDHEHGGCCNSDAEEDAKKEGCDGNGGCGCRG